MKSQKKISCHIPLIERFWLQVQKSEGCWNWIGSLAGYAHYRSGRIKSKGKSLIATRLSWQIHIGEIPEGLEVCHKCDNPLCVRPDHLFLGTHRDNMRDCVAKGRKGSQVGAQNSNSKLTEDQVRQIRERFPIEGGPKLAKEFGLERTVPWQIYTRKRWRHIT